MRERLTHAMNVWLNRACCEVCAHGSDSWYVSTDEPISGSLYDRRSGEGRTVSDRFSLRADHSVLLVGGKRSIYRLCLQVGTAVVLIAIATLLVLRSAESPSTG